MRLIHETVRQDRLAVQDVLCKNAEFSRCSRESVHVRAFHNTNAHQCQYFVYFFVYLMVNRNVIKVLKKECPLVQTHDYGSHTPTHPIFCFKIQETTHVNEHHVNETTVSLWTRKVLQSGVQLASVHCAVTFYVYQTVSFGRKCSNPVCNRR